MIAHTPHEPRLPRHVSLGKGVHADLQVARVAVGIAYAMFDELAKDNARFAALQRANPGKSTATLARRFVRRMAPLLLDEARATMAAMLKSHTNSELREQIYSALLRDATLRRGRGKGTR